MREILGRLPEALFEITIFGDDMILNEPIEKWPVVEVLIAFYSTGYPTAKVLSYVEMRHPFMINDLRMEATLKDRRKVYELLQANGIHVPVHVYCERDKIDNNGNLLPDTNVIEEFDEYILVNGQQINKPLVEKPVDAENHNIYIYYPNSAGGGSKRLFRKVNDRSSEFYPNENELRKEGSYIYEEFVVTQGTDVKVYTVGLDYGHAEARKSPVVDGKVNRDASGLEIRYPVILSPVEKEMAQRIVLAFKQTVCGFDILRVHGRSYCCDVNGFSFVKSSRKYYDDASQVLCEIMMNQVRSNYRAALSTRTPITRSRVKSSLTAIKPEPALTASNLAKAESLRKRSQASTNHSSGDEKGGKISASNSATPDNLSVDSNGNGEDVFTENSNKIPRPSSPTTKVKEMPFPSPIDYTSKSRRTSRGNLTDRDNLSADDGQQEELRCVIAITRHADRTPKQKLN